ncbi:hypothetical protein [Flavobacterium sp. HTF]|uniref:hypothetical protein n=1 Tax=Flavobacterium sp. HTF TaxID=2170732 RepID=UPI000D5F7084|nr:hypothetical protein [Flavobacterium sp. HTF]PWB27298.1 hypothetical protein DCO46_03340 [Flavobacterium sp. HTF]
MIHFDFYNDLKNEISKILNDSGLKISLDQNIHKILIDFYNLNSKILEPKKRNVLVVPDFDKQICLHHKKLEIQTIIQLAQDGGNLNCFQTHRIIQSKQIDHLSNEWNIFHFHLSLEPDKKSKFVKRGNLLLFAYVNEKDIVFLGLDKHKDSFSDIKWLEILEKNYPHIMKKFLAPDLPLVEQNFTTSDIEKMWQSGISSGFMNINGKTYLCPGFGKVTSGYNIKVVKKSSDIINWITHIQDIIKKENDFFDNELINLKLRIGEKTIEIYENEKGYIFFEFPSFEKKITHYKSYYNEFGQSD